MRKRLLKKKSIKSGLPPGSLVYVGDRKGSVSLTVFDYTADSFEQRVLTEVKQCFPYRDTHSVSWINVDGTQDVEIVRRLGECYGLHSLVQEDILNTDQRPKIEDYGNYLFIVLKMFSTNGNGSLVIEQVSFVLGPNFLLSFQEEGKEGDVFEPVRERIRSGKGKIRSLGTDYLVYSLVDAIVDNYFGILEQLGERIELLEDEVVTAPVPDTLRKIHELKREMIFLRKSVWPLREVIGRMHRAESNLIGETMVPYLRDIYDHTIQVMDAVETFRDMLSGMLDIYLSSISNRINEVMKVLTIIATIFIPLTFIVGVYGMNFKIPELEWRWGYLYVWILNISIAVVLLIFFRKKRWL